VGCLLSRKAVLAWQSQVLAGGGVFDHDRGAIVDLFVQVDEGRPLFPVLRVSGEHPDRRLCPRNRSVVPGELPL